MQTVYIGDLRVKDFGYMWQNPWGSDDIFELSQMNRCSIISVLISCFFLQYHSLAGRPDNEIPWIKQRIYLD